VKGGVKWGHTPHPLETTRSSTSGPISQWIGGLKYSPRRLYRTLVQGKKKKLMHSQNFESPNIYNLMQVSRSEHQEAQPGE